MARYMNDGMDGYGIDGLMMMGGRDYERYTAVSF